MRRLAVISVLVLTLVILGLSGGGQFWAPLSQTLFPNAAAQTAGKSAAKKFFAFDAHIHATVGAYRAGYNIGENRDPQFTLDMAEKGGLGAMFNNTSVDEFYYVNQIAAREALDQFDHLHRQVAMYPDRIGVARTADEIRALQKQGKLAAVFAISGGSTLEDDLSVLRMLHRLGLRLVSPMHFFKNGIGDVVSSKENNGKGGGLTPFGRELVAEMNRLGIIIDLAHASEQTSRDVIEASVQPVMNSHAGAKALLDLPMAWSDEMMRLLAAKGGLLCVPFIPQIISREYTRKHPPRNTANPRSRITGFDPMLYAGDRSKIYEFIAERMSRDASRREAQTREDIEDIPPLSDYIEDLDHVVKIMGVDHVCISSDWGATTVAVKGIEDAAEYQNIAQALLKKGYDEKDAAKIMGENMLQFFDQIVKTAGRDRSVQGGGNR